MDDATYSHSLIKEFKALNNNGTLQKDTQGQVIIELLDDEFKKWAFYITPHDGQFAGIQHDFLLHIKGCNISGCDCGHGASLTCSTLTCHPNISGSGSVCITIDEAAKNLSGYANMLLWLMINPDYGNPYEYLYRIGDLRILSCFQQAQTDKYRDGKLVPIITVNNVPLNDYKRMPHDTFKLENFQAIPVVAPIRVVVP